MVESNRITSLLLWGTILTSSCSTIDRRIVRQGKMHAPESAPPAALLLSRHEVIDGDACVLLLRKYSHPLGFGQDSAKFEKLTIQFEDCTPGKRVNLDSKSVSVFYSSGSQGYVYNGWGSTADKAVGTVEFGPIANNAMTISLDVTVESQGTLSVFQPSTRRFVEQAKFDLTTPSQLSPWLGSPGDSEAQSHP